MSCGVYKITNLITNKSYIGVSIHIEQRWKEHKNGHGSQSLYKDFWEYGIKNFSFEILEECPEEELYKKEPEWIKYYNSYKDGYNENPGGIDSNLQAIQKTKKEIYCYDLNGNFIKKYNSISEAERETGIPNTNISKAAKGTERAVAGPYQWRYTKEDYINPYVRTCHFKEKPAHLKKPVAQYDLNGNLINKFESIKEASEQTKVNKNSIGMVCNGQRKTAGKYIWKFIEE